MPSSGNTIHKKDKYDVHREILFLYTVSPDEGLQTRPKHVALLNVQYGLPNVKRVIKSRRLRGAGLLARMGGRRCA
jgi:hypothetical protein